MAEIIMYIGSLIIGAVTTAYFIRLDFIDTFLATSPMLLGIMLAGVLAVLALLPTALVRPKTVEQTRALDQFLLNISRDSKLVFVSTMISFASYLGSGFQIPWVPRTWLVPAARVLVFIDTLALGIAVSATWDILASHLHLQRVTYSQVSTDQHSHD